MYSNVLLSLWNYIDKLHLQPSFRKINRTFTFTHNSHTHIWYTNYPTFISNPNIYSVKKINRLKISENQLYRTQSYNQKQSNIITYRVYQTHGIKHTPKLYYIWSNNKIFLLSKYKLDKWTFLVFLCTFIDHIKSIKHLQWYRML